MDTTEEQRKTEYMRLKSVAETHGYKPGWASYKYKEQFNDWPPKEWTGFTGQKSVKTTASASGTGSCPTCGKPMANRVQEQDQLPF